jgi:hypothetical protein
MGKRAAAFEGIAPAAAAVKVRRGEFAGRARPGEAPIRAPGRSRKNEQKSIRPAANAKT